PLATAVAVTAILALVVVVRNMPGRHQHGRLATAARLTRWPVPGQPGWSAWSVAGRGRGDLGIDTLAASSPASGWVFASDNTGTGRRPVAWQLAGSAWTPVPFPGRRDESVSAATAISPSDAWAFTSDNRALHWNGRAWRVISGFPDRNLSDASDVAAVSPSDVWLFSGRYPQSGTGHSTWHYNGQAWTRVRAASGLETASVVSARDIWAAGGATIGHWNGTTWTKVPVTGLLHPRPPSCAATVTSIYGLSATDAWATGWQDCQDTGGLAVLLHYAGGRWQRVARLGDVDPMAIVPDGHGGLWIQVNPDPQHRGRAALLHFGHGALHTTAFPLPHQVRLSGAGVLRGDGTMFAIGERALGRNATAGFVLRYRP
ncbi:MAG: hypothetical protein ACRDOL_27120, partial [Streptosporangiaceae bacterium]